MLTLKKVTDTHAGLEKNKSFENRILLTAGAYDVHGNATSAELRIDVIDLQSAGIVVDVVGTIGAVAVLTSGGRVVTWGSKSRGGYSKHKNLTNVDSIVANSRAFAALKRDGSVVTWGDQQYGGEHPNIIQNVKTLVESNSAFAALTQDGKIIT